MPILITLTLPLEDNVYLCAHTEMQIKNHKYAM